MVAISSGGSGLWRGQHLFSERVDRSGTWAPGMVCPIEHDKRLLRAAFNRALFLSSALELFRRLVGSVPGRTIAVHPVSVYLLS